MQRVVSCYHATLKQTPKAPNYLKARGLVHGELTDASAYKTSYVYDQWGHKTRQTDGNGKSLLWVTDAFGRKISHTDMGGVSTTYTCDANRLIASYNSSATRSITTRP